MDETVWVWGTDIHALASDHGRKAKAVRGYNLFCLGWLGVLVQVR
jgi:hypothetical protein